MLVVLPAFFVIVSLSVAAIPLGPRANTPNIGLPSLIPAELTDTVPAKQLFNLIPKGPNLLQRFIMGADYASSSGPFLGKSSHKRQEDALSGTLSSTPLRGNGLIPPNLSPGSTPT